MGQSMSGDGLHVEVVPRQTSAGEVGRMSALRMANSRVRAVSACQSTVDGARTEPRCDDCSVAHLPPCGDPAVRESKALRTLWWQLATPELAGGQVLSSVSRSSSRSFSLVHRRRRLSSLLPISPGGLKSLSQAGSLAKGSHQKSAGCTRSLKGIQNDTLCNPPGVYIIIRNVLLLLKAGSYCHTLSQARRNVAAYRLQRAVKLWAGVWHVPQVL